MEAETNRLKAYVAEMQLDLSQKGQPVDITELAQGDDVLDVTFDYGPTRFQGVIAEEHGLSIGFTWDEILRLLGPLMIEEASERALRSRLSNEILGRIDEIPDVGQHSNPGVILEQSSFDAIKIQFRALGLIEPGTRKRAPSDSNTYWRLTQVGDRLLITMAAIRKAPAQSTPEPQP